MKQIFLKFYKNIYFPLFLIGMFLFLTALFYAATILHPQDWMATYFIGNDSHLNIPVSSYHGIGGYFHVAVDRYHVWTSRFLIELISFPLARHIVLWSFISSAITLLTMIIVSRGFANLYKISFKKSFVVVLVGLTFFSIDLLGGLQPDNQVTVFPAGVFATMNNYYWMICCVILSFYCAWQSTLLENKSVQYILIGFGALLSMIAVNSEQIAIFLFMFSSIVLIYKLLNNKIVTIPKCYILSTWVISLMGILNAYVSPGNKARAYFMNQRYPEYHTRSLFRKIDSTFQISMDWLTFQNILLAGLIIVMLVSLIKQKKIVETLLAGSLFVLMYGFPSNSLQNMIHNDILNISKKYPLEYVSETSITDVASWLPDLYYALLFVLLCYLFHESFKKFNYYKETIVLLIIGILSSSVIALSPNILVGSTRPFILFSIVLLLVLINFICGIIVDYSKNNQ
ncbi:hypothetical protein G6R29_04420 [Fructobacillus sp. M2-14]|uniref:Uncharacterized protein n=1 Tax=Fructobacillus broussonetiae TaxID=2713173 RepID=A0ABS5R091_9LACO|nr:hypothetical protein [Fructobacillus broussonetiae]MBS9338868.1 hypothetical protein [Fructobacillus broussonetiae]